MNNAKEERIEHRIKYFCDVNMGQSPDSSSVQPYAEDLSMPFLQGSAEFGALHPNPKNACESPPKQCGPGDILFSVRAPVGDMNLADRAYGIGRGLCSINCDQLNAKFVWWALHHYRVELAKVATGSMYMAVSAEQVRELAIRVPPHTTQHAIAAYLDRETSAIDALISEKESMLGLLEEKRQALVSHAVTQGLDSKAKVKPTGIEWLDRCPAHWETMQLKRTWESADYGTSSSIRDKGEIRVLRMSCITKSGTVDLNNAGQIEEIEESLFLQKGDILFNRTNSLDQIAKVGLVVEDPDDPTAFASYLVRIRVNERVDNRYLVKLLNSRDFLNFARANAIPAIGQANLSPTRYGDLHVPIPPRTEQLEIVEHIDEAVASSNAFETDLEMSITLLKERRSALITAAVSGKIAIEDMAT